MRLVALLMTPLYSCTSTLCMARACRSGSSGCDSLRVAMRDASTRLAGNLNVVDHSILHEAAGGECARVEILDVRAHLIRRTNDVFETVEQALVRHTDTASAKIAARKRALPAPEVTTSTGMPSRS